MWAWASLGLLCPTPTRLSWMMESLGALSSHKGCTSSCLLPPHEPLSLLENTVASPPARSPSQPDNIQPFSGQASTPELLCLAQTQFLHVSSWTSTLPLCRWAVQVQRPWVSRPWCGQPCGELQSFRVWSHSVPRADPWRKIHLSDIPVGEKAWHEEDMQPVGANHAESSFSAAGSPKHPLDSPQALY